MDSSVCGQYCVYYVVLRSRGKDMDSIVRLFSKNKKLNDSFVDEFVSHYFPFSHDSPHNVQVSFRNKRV